MLLTGIEGTWEEKIGGSTPPIMTERGWLMLYHGVEHGGVGHYRVGALLLDKENPLKIIGRTTEPILEPDSEHELIGYYNGCVFPTGNVIVKAICLFIMVVPISISGLQAVSLMSCLTILNQKNAKLQLKTVLKHHCARLTLVKTNQSNRQFKKYNYIA